MTTKLAEDRSRAANGNAATMIEPSGSGIFKAGYNEASGHLQGKGGDNLNLLRRGVVG